MTGAPLHLDTARAGPMAPRAREALYALHEFASDEGLSKRFDDLLLGGTAAWPRPLVSRYPGLSAWHGIEQFRLSLRRLLGLPAGREVLLANRSSQLMKLAARLLFRRCERVLTTDLEWPAYLRLLEEERARTGFEVHRVALHAAVLQGHAPAEQVIAAVVAAYEQRRCDGLFLAAVGNLGVRLPVERICRAVEVVRTPRFVVIDGAQAFCHTPEDLGLAHCDFFIAGCHKWLCAFHPLGIGFSVRPRSEGYVRTTLSRMIELGELDDPLLRFIGELERGGGGQLSETVSVGPLFSAQAALEQFREEHGCQSWPTLLANTQQLIQACRGVGWRPLPVDAELQTGILLCQAERKATRAGAPEAIRRRFEDQGVVLTAYPEGLIRVSVPRRPWTAADADFLQGALQAAA